MPKELQPPIMPGFIAKQATLEDLCQQKILPRAFDWMPQGHRILVLKDKVPEKIGNIVLTEQQQDESKMGTGWVIAVGPLAGVQAEHAPYGPMCTTPAELLYQHILFGAWSGQDVRFSIYDRDYNCEIVLMTSLDIWMIDEAEDPMALEAQFEEAFRQKIGEAALAEVEAGAALEEQRRSLVTEESGV